MHWNNFTGYLNICSCFHCNLKHHVIVRKMGFLITIHCTLTYTQLMEERCSFLTIVSPLLLFLMICRLSNLSCVLLNNLMRWKMSHTSPYLCWIRIGYNPCFQRNQLQIWICIYLFFLINLKIELSLSIK